MFENFKLTTEVKRAMDRAQAILDERQRIREAITRAQSLMPGAEAAMQHAQEALAEAEADSALAAAATSTRAERNDCADARVQLDAITARINGLQKRLAKTDDAVLAAEEELATARKEFTRRVLDDFRQDYQKAAEKFAEVLRVGRGLQEGLGRPLNVNFKLIDPEHSDNVLVPLFELKREPHAGWLEQWLENQTARGAYESVRGPKDAAGIVSRETKEIRTRRENAAAAEAKRRFDAEPRPVSLVREYPPEPPQPEVPKVEIRSARMFPDNPERAAEVPQFANMNPSE